MKRAVLIAVLLGGAMAFVAPTVSSAAYNFGDFRSATLTTKAWEALKAKDLEGVLAYTNKCIELYAAEAQKMQASLTAFPTGTEEQVFAFWALNDVGTALFIQGEAYRNADMKDEAVIAYKKVMDEYSFAQCWDPASKAFWKPGSAAKEKAAMIASGSVLDFGDYTSSFLAGQAWKALEKADYDSVNAYTDKVLELYADKAKEMQNSLTEYPWQSRETIFNFWALNDVGTALYVKGEAYKRAGKSKEAKMVLKRLVDEFFYAQCWDPQGWFWKPAEAAQQALDELGDI